MRFVKKIQNGNSCIEIYGSDISSNEKRANLINLYKIINNIAEQQMKNNNDVTDWFYSKHELDLMKKTGNYNFL